MKKQSQQKREAIREPLDPQGLKHVVTFDEELENDFNSLCADPSGRLFMSDTVYEQGRWFLLRGKVRIPVEFAAASDFHEVSLKNALEWFVKIDSKLPEFTGSTAILCAMAAKQLR